MKNTEEKKISSLYIYPEFRGQGVGTALIQVAIRVLRTNTPVITIPEPLLAQFENILAKYGFVKTKEVSDLYTDGVTEIFFNDCK